MVRSIVKGSVLGLALLVAGAVSTTSTYAAGTWIPNGSDARALGDALEEHDVERIKEMLSLGLDPNYTLLIALIDARGRHEIVKALLAAGADPDRRMTNGLCPITWAASEGDAPTAKLLLDAGACPLAEDSSGWTTMMWASGLARRGGCIPPRWGWWRETQDVLRSAGVSEAGLKDVALLDAIEMRDEGKARVVLADGADPHARDSNGTPALVWAAYQGQLDLLGELLDTGVDPNERSATLTPLTAVMTNTVGDRDRRLASLWVLLERGSDPNVLTSSGTALTIASDRADRLEAARMLLSAGADPNLTIDNGHAPLMNAAAGGVLETVRLLLDAGARVNARDWTGRTALFAAAAQDQGDTIRFLVAAGADINAHDMHGKSALRVAQDAGSHHAVEALRECGAR